MHNRRPAVRARWRLGAVAVVIAGLVASIGWQGTGDRAEADPIFEPPTSGTATGQFRTGLTRAGLVSLESIDDAHLWLGLDDEDDKNATFDVRVELLNNGTPVASGMRRCLGGFDRDRDPREVTVAFDDFDPPTLQVGDVLALRVTTRIGTKANGAKCQGRDHAEGLRLHYGSARRDSSVGVTITPDPNVDLHLGSSGGRGCSATRLSLSEGAPGRSTSNCRASGDVAFRHGNPWARIGTWDLPAQLDYDEAFLPEVRNAPAAPDPEPIALDRLPLPPIAPSNTPGSCDLGVNPNGTGCIGGLGQLGGFIDADHVVGNVTFAGAPAGSPYTGGQLVIVKTDGTTFPNGDTWKCVTCGIPEANRQGISGASDYPQPFNDGRRILRGTNIIDCAPHQLTDDACTPAATHIYPIAWDTGSTTGFVQKMRELRIHPDDTHLGWNAFVAQPGGIVTEYGGFGRLTFNPTPTTGVPRYDLTDVSWMFNTTDPALNERTIVVDPTDPTQLQVNPPAGHIGEFRGFTSDGTAALGIGTQDSCNWDPWATDLRTGESRRLGRNPNYMDPMNSSPDDNWTVLADGRTDNRMAFLGAMPGIPPVVDLAGCALREIYNNGNRRFFQPYLLDRYGDRGSYEGQAVNGGHDPTPGSGSFSDPLWNGQADPQWSPDGTAIAYWQAQVTAPACGGPNPIVCPVSREPGGLRTRWVLARLTSRDPLPPTTVDPVADEIAWGIAYTPGDSIPVRPHLPAGTYTLPGRIHGSATVVITETPDLTQIASIEVTYTDYSDDGINVINGSHSRTAIGVYHEDLTLSGAHTGTRTTTEPSGWVFAGATRTGTLTTTIDGTTYTSPPSNQ